jgi:flotillin
MLYLKLIQVDVITSNFVPTADYINIRVDAVVNVKISNKLEHLDLAAINFLNMSPEDIKKIAMQVLEGNIREIVGKMCLRDMVTDREKFSNEVKANAIPDLEKMGLEIISFNVQNFSDEGDVIKNLGIDNISKIKKDAAIAKANAEMEIAKAQSEADRLSNEAYVASQLDISKKKTDLDIKISELKVQSDSKKADADAAYSIQQQTQRKAIEISTAEANLAKLNKETEVQTAQVALTERTLEANVRKTAEAERFKIQQEADAELYRRQKVAEAAAYEAKQALEAEKAKAEATRYTLEQEAEGIRAKGIADAEAIKAKALAEAEGISAKADAQAKMADAAKLEMLTKVLPEVARAVAEPLSNVDSITLYGEGNSGKMIGDIMTSIDKIAAGTGIDIKAVLSGLTGGLISKSLPASQTESDK